MDNDMSQDFLKIFRKNLFISHNMIAIFGLQGNHSIDYIILERISSVYVYIYRLNPVKMVRPILYLLLSTDFYILGVLVKDCLI